MSTQRIGGRGARVEAGWRRLKAPHPIVPTNFSRIAGHDNLPTR